MNGTELRTGNQQTALDALNAILADAFALYVKTKSFHLHMSGQHFRDYHRLLDEQAAQVFALIDPLAERIRKSGSGTLRSIGDIARHQTITDNDATSLSAGAMPMELKRDNAGLVDAAAPRDRSSTAPATTPLQVSSTRGRTRPRPGSGSCTRLREWARV